MKPSKIEYQVGETRHKQPLRLIFSRGTDGVYGWTIQKDPASQRDDSVHISGIPSDVILQMAEAVKGESS